MLERVLKIYEKHSSEQKGFIYAEMAKVQKKQEQLDKAIALQQQAIEYFESLEKYQNSEVTAELLCTLGQWQEAKKNIDESLMSFQKAYEIYEQLYGLEDRDTVRVKRNIAYVLLRGRQY